VRDFKPNIWQLQAQYNTEGLVTALSDDDAGIRRRAAAALLALGAVKTISHLEQALDYEQDPETRDAMLVAIQGLNNEKRRREESSDNGDEQPDIDPAVQEQLNRLRSKRIEEVIDAAGQLGDLGDKVAVPMLMVLFTNAKVPIKIRLAVAEALLKLESAPVEVTLLGALRSEDWHTRRNGAAILGRLQATWAVEPLARALRDKNETVRKTAYAALKHIGTDEAKAAIEKLRRTLERSKNENRVSELNSADGNEAGKRPSVLDTQELVWPSRKNKKKQEEEELDDSHPTLAPTKPFDPDVIVRAREQFEEMKRRRAEEREQETESEPDSDGDNIGED